MIANNNNVSNLSIYDTSAWVEFRGVPKSLGQNKTTHFAKIIDDAGKLHNCYVKLLNLQTPSLIGESIGWLLAKANSIPCSQFACVVFVPIKELEKHIQLPDWATQLEAYPAWCTEIVNGKSLAQMHRWEYLLYRKSCFKSKDVSSIAAMDYWTDNRDRNTGNVIRNSNGKYIAIDHETLLHDLLWLAIGIKFEERSLLSSAKLELSKADAIQFNLDVAIAGKQHEEGYKSALVAIEEILSKIYGSNAPALITSIKNYIEPRSKSGWLSKELGVIV